MTAMTDPLELFTNSAVFLIEILFIPGILVLATRYLRRLDQPKRRPATKRSYNHTYYNIDRAVFINADPSASRSSFQLGRGAALPATALRSLPRGDELMLLEASRPFKNAPEAEKRAFARRQDAIMRGYA